MTERILDDRSMCQATRDHLIDHLAEAIATVSVAHPTRVAIDGAPATGKTTLADELRVALHRRGREVIRAGIDNFLFPRVRRYWRGEYSAEGCYFDAHDHRALARVLLDPLGPGGDRHFQPAVYDSQADTTWSPPLETAPADAVLLFDGVFLMRPELYERWDLRVLVSTALERTVERAVMRDRGRLSRAEIERRWKERYHPAQRLYVESVHPAEHADVIVHNDCPQHPAWEFPTR